MKLAAAMLAVVAVACSASAEDECQFVGSYSFSSVHESGNCPPGSDGGTTTISADPDGGYLIEATGGIGACHADVIGTCKLQAKCDARITDALDANDNMATIQDSWTFNASGFRGTVTVSIPPAKSIPAGCLGTVRATGARR